MTPRLPMCQGPDCDREATIGVFCAAHYMQARRGRDLKPLRSDDNTEQFVIRLSAELKTATVKAAKKAGVTLAEWWRAAAKKAL